MRRLPGWKWFSKKRTWIPLTAVSVYLLFGFLAVGPLARSQAEKILPTVLHRKVRIERVAFNPLRLGVDIWGFAVEDKNGETFIGFDKLWVNVSGLELLRGVIGFDEIHLTRPLIGVGLEKNGDLDIADLLKPAEAETTPAEPATPRVLRIRSFSLTD